MKNYHELLSKGLPDEIMSHFAGYFTKIIFYLFLNATQMFTLYFQESILFTMFEVVNIKQTFHLNHKGLSQ